MRRLQDKADRDNRWVRYEMDVQMDADQNRYVDFGEEEYAEFIAHFTNGIKPEDNLREAKRRLKIAVEKKKAWESLYGILPDGNFAETTVIIFFNYKGVL